MNGFFFFTAGFNVSFVLLLVGIVLSLVSAILWIAVGAYVGQLQDR